MPRVIPISGEPLRYEVESSEPGKENYLVDLAEFSFNGQCSCEHFDYRLRKILEDGGKGILRCKHIILAREFFLETHLRWVAKTANARRVQAYNPTLTIKGDYLNN